MAKNYSIKVLAGLTLLMSVLGNGIAQQVSMVQDIHPSGSSYPERFTILGNNMVFKARDGVNDTEPWTFDGTTASMIMDIHPSDESDPSGFYVYDGSIIYSADDGNGSELWETDGVTTSMIADLNPSGGSWPSNFFQWGLVVFFTADNGTDGRELYVYDGTNAVQLGNNNPGPGDFGPRYFIEYAGNLYFTADGGSNGRELWMYDGSSSTEVANINSGGDSDPKDLIVYNGILYFSADDGTTGIELWQYDGTSVTQVQDINPSGDGRPQFMNIYNGKMYFRADDGTNGRELWSYDGTTVVMEGNNNPVSDFDPQDFHIYNGELYFSATDGTAGQELWKYDGTTLTLMADLEPGGGASWPREMTEFHGELYFTAETNNSGYELYKTDGTTTSLVMDINPTPGDGSSPSYLNVFKNAIYFHADDGVNGTELWRLCFPDSSAFSVTSCGSYTLPSGNLTYTVSGTYFDTIPATSGCDSMMTITVTINAVDTTITQVDAITLSANATAASYQWIDCGTMVPTGDTSQTFVATSNGDYAVVIDDGICSDTSACFSINGVGITEIGTFQMALMPNPNEDHFVLQLGSDFVGSLEVLNMAGQVVSREQVRIHRSTGHQINHTLISGYYLVRLIDETGRSAVRPMIVR